MKPILIKHVSSLETNLKGRPTPGWPTKELFSASLVFVVSPTHFICLKNRWDRPSTNNELIPTFLLSAYIKRYAECFTKEELLDALISSHYDE